MTAAVKPFYCLRCGHKFRAEHEKGVVVERSCPKCSSNSVRLVPDDARKGGTATEKE